MRHDVGIDERYDLGIVQIFGRFVDGAALEAASFSRCTQLQQLNGCGGVRLEYRVDKLPAGIGVRIKDNADAEVLVLLTNQRLHATDQSLVSTANRQHNQDRGLLF